MTRRMLINAQTREELRVAIVDGQTLEDFQVEVAERGSTRGNIYRGTIAKIEPSLNAAFIDYGAERHGFLPIQDVVSEAYYKKPRDDKKRPRIEDVLERGKPIVVQVVKEAEAQKGAALTTNISLAGRYLVLTPFDSTRGISRKVEDDDVRKGLKEQIKKLDVPSGCGIIVRTNALDQNKTALSRDLSSLLRLWKRVGTEAREGKGVKLIYSDQDLILQALRDYLDPSMEEILVDEAGALARAEEYLKAYMPRGGNRLVHYQEREPLFSRYGIEPQIDRIYDRRVSLPSGGSIVIDRTEALTAIDVNSGRSTGASSQEQTALDTNLEAAAEVARQLRLRDIGGLLVVDFIDMRASRSQRKVEKALKDAMKPDKARSSVGRISSNGLLEINRQRIHQALSMRTHRTCPSCDGTGRVPGPEMVGLNLLRRIRARAATASLAKVRLALHPELAEAFQNQRRHDLAKLEDEFDLRIEIVASPRLNLREQEVEWEKRTEGNGRPALVPAVSPASVRVGDTAAELAAQPEEDEEEETGEETTREEAARERRRSRSRRTRAKGGDKVAAAEETKGRRKAEGGKKETKEEEGEEKGGRRTARRSGRKSSRKAAPREEKEAPREEKEAAAGKSGKEEETKTRPRRSRSRRRSTSGTAEAPEAAAAAGGEEGARETRSRSGRTRRSTAAAAEGSEEGKPTRRRRSRSRSRSEGASEESAKEGAKESKPRRRRRSSSDSGSGSGDSAGRESGSGSGAAEGAGGESSGGRRRRTRRSSAGSSDDSSTSSRKGDESGSESSGGSTRRRRRRRSSSGEGGNR